MNTFSNTTIPALQTSYAVVDLETTGGSSTLNQIIEIGIVNIENGEITNTYQTFLNPGGPIPPFISQITGITDSDVEYAPLFPDIVENIMPLLRDRVFVAHNVSFDYYFLKKNLKKCGIEFTVPKVCTVQLAKKVIPQIPHHTLDDVARFFHITIPQRHRALDDAIAAGKSLVQMIDMMSQQGMSALNNIFKLSQTPESVQYEKFSNSISELPHKPGVYIMKDKEGHIIYVGKAKDLQKRVRSYFSNSIQKPEKVTKLVSKIESIDHEQTGSELGAFLLEAKKIREHQPYFNKMIKNYKSYPYIKFSDETYPRAYLVNDIKSDSADYFGPFKSKSLARQTVEQITLAFKLRTCKYRLGPHSPLRLCSNYHLGKCSGACGGKITFEEYTHNVSKAKNFLTGNSDILKNIEKELDLESKNQRYEKAAELRDQLVVMQRMLTLQQGIAQSIKENNLIIIEEGLDYKVNQLFFVKNGLLQTTLLVKKMKHEEHTNSSEEWLETLNEIYNQPVSTMNKENIDELFILSRYLAENKQSKKIYRVGENRKTLASILGQEYSFN